MSEMMARVDERTQLVGRNRLELLLFFLNDTQCFGINVFKVREVIDCPQMTQTPDAHEYVTGIAKIRDKIISVVDLSAVVGKGPIDRKGTCRVIITEYNRRVQGFLVRDVEKIVNLNWQQVKPPPKGVGNASFLTAVTDVEGRLVEVLDVEKILADILGVKDIVSPDTISESQQNDYANNHVLVIDDSSMARKQMARVLDQLDLPYMILKNGKEAYDLLLSWVDDTSIPVTERCGLIVSDVEMPEMDGYTLTKKIKDHPELRKLKVLLHSSISGTFNMNMVSKVGADDFLAKYDPDELARRIMTHLQNNNH